MKIYTGQKKFTQAPPVAPLTNMRYGGDLHASYDHVDNGAELTDGGGDVTRQHYLVNFDAGELQR